METVLITGGAGFIGSHLCEAYLSEGYKVVVLDSLSTGKRQNIPKECSFFEVDIRDKVGLENVFEEVKPTIVSHHAAQTKISISNAYPYDDADINIQGLLNVLTASEKYKVRYFVFASSAAVYGEPKSVPIVESLELQPISAYGIAKMAGEKYVELFAQRAIFDALILRYSNVYGPRQISNSEGGVVSIFINNAVNKMKSIAYGDGTQTRDFVFVKDIAMINLIATKKKLSGVFNIGTCIETSINELYSFIDSVYKAPFLALDASNNPGSIRSIVSSKKLLKKIGKFEFIKLSEGIRSTIDWHKLQK